jgi:serine/threonine protein kinase
MFRLVMDEHDIATATDLRKLSQQLADGSAKLDGLQSSLQNNGSKLTEMDHKMDKALGVLHKKNKAEKRISRVRRMEISRDAFTIDRTCRLGKGGFAEVFKGIYDNEDVAIKVFLVLDSSVKELSELWGKVSKEVDAMAQLQHHNIVRAYGAYQALEKKEMGLILELMEGQSLKEKLNSYSDAGEMVPTTKLHEWLLDMALGIRHIISKGFCHCDIKSANMLFTASGQLKVADFGLAVTIANSSTFTRKGVGGSIAWMAPEQHLAKGNAVYTEATDAYAFGIVMWEMATCKTPWAGSTAITIVKDVGMHKERPPIPDNCNEKYRALMTRSWDQDAAQRPSFKEIVPLVQDMQNASPLASSTSSTDDENQVSELEMKVKDLLPADLEKDVASLDELQLLIEKKDAEYDLAIDVDDFDKAESLLEGIERQKMEKGALEDRLALVPQLLERGKGLQDTIEQRKKLMAKERKIKEAKSLKVLFERVKELVATLEARSDSEAVSTFKARKSITSKQYPLAKEVKDKKIRHVKEAEEKAEVERQAKEAEDEKIILAKEAEDEKIRLAKEAEEKAEAERQSKEVEDEKTRLAKEAEKKAEAERQAKKAEDEKKRLAKEAEKKAEMERLAKKAEDEKICLAKEAEEKAEAERLAKEAEDEKIRLAKEAEEKAEAKRLAKEAEDKKVRLAKEAEKEAEMERLKVQAEATEAEKARASRRFLSLLSPLFSFSLLFFFPSFPFFTSFIPFLPLLPLSFLSLFSAFPCPVLPSAPCPFVPSCRFFRSFNFFRSFRSSRPSPLLPPPHPPATNERCICIVSYVCVWVPHIHICIICLCALLYI